MLSSQRDYIISFFVVVVVNAADAAAAAAAVVFSAVPTDPLHLVWESFHIYFVCFFSSCAPPMRLFAAFRTFGFSVFSETHSSARLPIHIVIAHLCVRKYLLSAHSTTTHVECHRTRARTQKSTDKNANNELVGESVGEDENGEKI